MSVSTSSELKTNQSVRKRRLKELISYFGVAGVAYGFNVGSRIIYNDYLGLSFEASITLAYGTGMVVAFTLSKLFLFGAKGSGNLYKELAKFVLVSTAAWFVTLQFALFALKINNYYLQEHPEVHAWAKTNIGKLGFKFLDRRLLSHVFGTGFGFVTNFIGHKLFTFRSTNILEKIGLK